MCRETADLAVWCLTKNEWATSEIDPEHSLFSGGPLYTSENSI